MSGTTYFFVPCGRRGMARAIAAPPLRGRALANVQLSLEAEKVGSGVDTPALTLPRVELYGPGDILGFDERMIVRRDPRPNVGDFEPNFFVSVEFDEADFPWRFTPDVAGDAGLIPWITLIVLARDAGEYEDGSPRDRGLPGWITAQRAKLPSLQHSWRWAHVMVTGDDAGTSDPRKLLTETDSDPDRVISRLICSRHLSPNTAYQAFIVPTFELGRLAGRGLSVPDDLETLTFSWPSPWTAPPGTSRPPGASPPPSGPPPTGTRPGGATGSPAPSPGTRPGGGDSPAPLPEKVELPYYARWEFSTGARGDFEYLVRLLQPRELKGLGKKPMACPPPGYGVPGVDRSGTPEEPHRHALGLEGALASFDFVPTAWGRDPEKPVAAPGKEPLRIELARLINMPQADSLPKVVALSALGFPANSTALDNSPDPVVAPPIYGRWHALQRFVSTSASAWCDVLNLDPRHRAAAGFGSLVVQRLQEDLMASAWRQLGSLELANDVRSRGQLGRDGSLVLYNRLKRLLPPANAQVGPGTGKFLRLTAPVFSRVLLGGATRTTVVNTFAASSFPMAALDAAFRRITRLRGPIRKRQLRAQGGAVREAFLKQDDVLLRLGTGKLVAAGPPPRAIGLFGICEVTLGAFGILGTFTPPDPNQSPVGTPVGGVQPGRISVGVTPVTGTAQPVRTTTGATVPATGTVQPVSTTVGVAPPPGPAPAPGTPTLPAPSVVKFCEKDTTSAALVNAITQLKAAFPQALSPWGAGLAATQAAVVEALDGWLQPPTPPPAKGPPSLAGATDALRVALDPRKSIPARIAKRFELTGVVASADPLAPIMAAPEFPQPMYAPLAEISQDLVLPGVDTVPQNTLSLLQVNMRFIEAYMCGCNHEFAGELLWREYPTDQRGSYFRQFFEVADAVSAAIPAGTAEPGAVPEKAKDIKKLHGWGTTALGSHGNRPIEPLVLLVRGDLLKKYPNTLVYAVPAKPDGAPDLEGFTPSPSAADSVRRFPIITGSLAPDLTFFGFELTKDQVRSSSTSKGWYFVLEERVSEPRFGIDEESGPVSAPDTPPPNPSTQIPNWRYLAWTHFPGVVSGNHLDGAEPTVSAVTAMPNESWAFSSAAIASILLQDPVRVAVHADQMLPPLASQS